jgi:hypothetical protein
VDSIFLEFNLPNSATWFYFSLLLAVALLFQFTRLLSLRNWDLLALFVFVPGFLLVQEAHQLTLLVVPDLERADWERFVGYLWLLAASGYWVIRCLLDLTRVRRPALRPNLTMIGMAWFGIALFICLCAVAVRRPAEPWTQVGKQPAAISGVKEGAAAVVNQTQGPADAASAAEVRFWVERGLAILGHLAVVLGLLFIGIFHYREADTGVAMGTLYLLLPYTAYHFGQIHHVLPSALIVWAAFAFRVSWLSGLLLGLAAGSSFFPVLLFPVWFHFYWKRGAGRFAAGFLAAGAVGLAVTLLVLYAAGVGSDGLSRTLFSADWQSWKRPSSEGVWTAVRRDDDPLAAGPESRRPDGPVGGGADRHPVLVRRPRRAVRLVVRAAAAANGVPAVRRRPATAIAAGPEPARANGPSALGATARFPAGEQAGRGRVVSRRSDFSRLFGVPSGLFGPFWPLLAPASGFWYPSISDLVLPP